MKLRPLGFLCVSTFAAFLVGEFGLRLISEHWLRIRALFPAATHRELAGAGHWLHADAPAAFAEAVAGFLDS